jgi:type I restriction enzyme, S subunit
LHSETSGLVSKNGIWPRVRLDELCEARIATRDPRDRPAELFTYVDISSVDNSAKRIVAAKQVRGSHASSRARQVIHAGDVLVSTTRPNLNAVALVPDGLDDEIASTGFCVLRPLSSLVGEFLFAFVQSREFVSALSDLVKGALYPAVTDGHVRALAIPLPPLAEQRRIAARLREQLSILAEVRAALEAQLAAAKALLGAHLRAVFKSPEAQSWSRSALGNVCEFLPAKSIATAGDVEVRAITSACLAEAGFSLLGVKPARMRSQDVAESTVHSGEILIARSNTPELVGRVAIFLGEAPNLVASDLTIRLMPRSTMDGIFLTRYLSQLYLSGYWRERASGASGTMKKITRGQLLCEQVPTPPLDEQRAVAAHLTLEFAAATKLRAVLQSKLTNIETLRAALLQAAFQSPS